MRDDGRRLDDQEAGALAGPDAGQPDPEDAVTLPQPRALHRHPENRQLLAEGQIAAAITARGTRNARRKSAATVTTPIAKPQFGSCEAES